MPLRTGPVGVVRGVVRRTGARRTGAVLRLDEPPAVAAPEVVPPPPISCCAMATPAVNNNRTDQQDHVIVEWYRSCSFDRHAIITCAEVHRGGDFRHLELRGLQQ